MEYKGVNYLHPDWGMWEQFLYDDRNSYKRSADFITFHNV